jgi:hypothetical protein
MRGLSLLKSVSSETYQETHRGSRCLTGEASGMSAVISFILYPLGLGSGYFSGWNVFLNLDVLYLEINAACW